MAASDHSLTRHEELLGEDAAAPLVAQQFGGVGLDYQSRYSVDDELFGRIAVKARRHAANDPLALFRDPLTLGRGHGVETPLWSIDPFSGLSADPWRGGGVLVPPAFAARHGLNAGVVILGQSMTTDAAEAFSSRAVSL